MENVLMNNVQTEANHKLFFASEVRDEVQLEQLSFFGKRSVA
jgi:hypothetical protein